MYCGNCFRDNAMVAELRQKGHDACLLPLYLPMTLDEENQSNGMPIFFSGINVYLDQKLPWFRQAPGWLHDLLSSTQLLKRVARFAAKTRAEDLGELTYSMLQGAHGNQARELSDMITWLKRETEPDIVCLSNALLSGFARPIQAGLDVPVACMLQGEDGFLDSLTSPWKERCWGIISENLAACDQLMAPSHYFANVMSQRLGLAVEKIKVISNGINTQGFHRSTLSLNPPVLGYFARLCPEKGLDVLVDAFLLLKKRNRFPGIKLKCGGGLGPSDASFVAEQKRKIATAGFESDVSWHPNLDRQQKMEFLSSLTLFSVPARYSEAFGLYLIEAMAAGVPVLQPRHAAFTELITESGAGVLFEPGNPEDFAVAIETILGSESRLKELADQAFNQARSVYSVSAMTDRMLEGFEHTLSNPILSKQ